MGTIFRVRPVSNMGRLLRVRLVSSIGELFRDRPVSNMRGLFRADLYQTWEAGQSCSRLLWV